MFAMGLDEFPPRALRISDMDCGMDGLSKGIVHNSLGL